MKKLNHLLGTCQDHASHLDLRDILIIATIAIAFILTVKTKRNEEDRKQA